MSMTKAEIKKAIALGKKIHAKFLAHATTQGTREQVLRILDVETERATQFAEAFGGVVDIRVNGTKVVVWKGMTKEQLRHQVNIAFVKMANSK